MDFIPLIGVLIAAFIAWKLLKGVVKLAVIGLLIAGAAWLFLGGGGRCLLTKTAFLPIYTAIRTLP
mgnify:CR=1 FL=1